MTALAKDKDTPELVEARVRVLPVSTGKKIFLSAIIVRNATGYAEPATTATAKVAMGFADEFVDNTSGADGAVTVRVRRATRKVVNDGSITIADVGGTAYAVDDQTIAKTDNSGARSACGTIYQVDSDGVWLTI